MCVCVCVRFFPPQGGESQRWVPTMRGTHLCSRMRIIGFKCHVTKKLYHVFWCLIALANYLLCRAYGECVVKMRYCSSYTDGPMLTFSPLGTYVSNVSVQNTSKRLSSSRLKAVSIACTDK